MLTGLLARRWCKSPKPFVYDKFAEKKAWSDKDQGLLTLHDFTPPIILYAQLKVYKLPLKIKLWALLIRLGIPVSFFFASFSLLFSSVFPSGWLTERGCFLRPLTCLGFYDPLKKVPKVRHIPQFERASAASVVRANLVSQVLLVSHVNQSNQASFSPLLLSFHLSRPPEGIPGSNRGWTPGLRGFCTGRKL